MSKKVQKPGHFTTVPIVSVPQGRLGKHSHVVNRILNDLSELDDGSALRIPLSVLGDTKLANVRSALNRATRQRAMNVATSTDGEYLYVWWGDGNRRKKRISR